MTRPFRICLTSLLASALLASTVVAQPLGTFRWQLQPYCNVVTVAVTQNGAVYRLEGTDDQCGNGAEAASVIGTAFPNPDGTIGFGLNIVTAPGGQPLHVDAEITVGTFSGTWRDSAGGTGSFLFTPGAGNGGTPRPLPAASPIPTRFVLRDDGGFLAVGTQGSGTIPAVGVGVRMMWFPGKAAFRAGIADATSWDDGNVGIRSVAMGEATRASGNASTAFGSFTIASGQASTALGHLTVASGGNSTATGFRSVASGSHSLAMGFSTEAIGSGSTAMGSDTTAGGLASLAAGSNTTASGNQSTAMGFLTTASGQASTAMGGGTIASGFNTMAMGRDSVAAGDEAVAAGLNVTANGHGSVVLGSRAAVRSFAPGSFLFGDRSTTTDVVATTPNVFGVRAAGGAFFFSNAAMTLGVQLSPSGSQWLSISDVRAKHRFRELDDDDILGKIAAMPVTEWSYKAQDDAIRHIGPTAQDFHAAFGLGEDPLRIGTLDADGVALAAVKALEARTRPLPERAATLEAENASLRAQVEELRERVAELIDDNTAVRDRVERLERLLTNTAPRRTP